MNRSVVRAACAAAGLCCALDSGCARTAATGARPERVLATGEPGAKGEPLYPVDFAAAERRRRAEEAAPEFFGDLGDGAGDGEEWEEEEEEAGPERIPGWTPQAPWRVASTTAEFGFEAVPGTGWVPADAGMAVGMNHIVAIVNGQVAFFTKDGSNTFRRPLAGAAGFWADLGAAGMVFDPEAHYDPFHDRFWIAACEQTGSAGFFDIAVSDDGDPNGAWHRYRIDASAAAGGVDIDSVNMAVASNAVYLTADYDSGGVRTLVGVLPVGPLLDGQAAGGARWTTISGIKGAGLLDRWDTTGAAQFIAFAPTSSGGATAFTLYAVTNPLTAPAVVGTSVPVPLYLPPGRPEQPGTGLTVEIFGARLWSTTFRAGSLWATHHVTDPESGRTVVRWYEIATGSWPASGQPVLRQWGQIDSGGDLYTYCPSIGVDAQGNAALTYVRSGPDEYITVCRALRRAGDTAGTLRAPQVVRESTASFTVLERWGDYSTTQADPAAACTFWGHHMWTTSSSDWRTWVGRYDNRPTADLTGDCQLNVLDFNAMVNLYGVGDLRADIDGNGTLNILDFGAFVNAFGLGR